MAPSIWTRFLVLLLAGTAVFTVPAPAAPFKPAEKSAIATLVPPGGHLKRLDMSNAKTRQALTALWRAAGVPADKIAARLAVKRGVKHTAVAENSDPVFQYLGFSGAAWSKVAAHSFVATAVETSLTDVTVTVMDAQQNIIAEGDVSTQNSAKPVFVATTEGDNTGSGLLTAVTVIYILYKDGTPSTFAYQATGNGLPTAIANQAPEKVGTAVVPQVLICTDKSITGCDYSLAQSGAGKIQIPLKGSATFAAPIDLDKNGKPANASAVLYVTGATGGAVCPLASGKSFFNEKSVTVSGATVSWDFSRADFGSNCYTANAGYDLVLSMMVMIGGQPAWAAIASDPSMEGTLGTVASRQFQMLKGYGGVAGDMVVTMADGSTKPIATIVVGDLVKGIVPMTVYALVSGKMTQSNTLTVAPNAVTTIFEQLLPTQRGVLQAQKVLLSDSVTTENGPTQIVERSQKRLTVPADVVNLFLTPQSGGSATAPTYLAGGIQVQDATTAAP